MNTSSHSRTCRAAVFVGPRRPLELRNIPVPTPSEHEALVRVECCTICGSDLHTITGARTELVPSILGHEVLGIVEQVGDPPLQDIDGTSLRPGDRVTWSVAVSCGQCDRCSRGLFQKCRTSAKYGHALAEGRFALSGGLSELMLLRQGTTAIRVVPDLPAEMICPVNCATATICAALRAACEVNGRSVLVLGGGMLGLTAAAIAKSRSAATVVVCDTNPDRLQLAARFGAQHAIEWQHDPDEFQRRLANDSGIATFDIVLELSGAPDAVEAACRLGDVGAKVALVGTVMKSRPVQLDPESIVRRCLSIHGVHNYAPEDLRMAVDFLSKFGAAHPFAELVESSYPLHEINTALQSAVRNRPIRIAIRP